MAKNTNKKPAAPAQAKPQYQKPPVKAAPTAAAKTNFFEGRYAHIIVMAVIGLITWLFLSPCLSNQFTNWDDPGYIKDNPLIKDISSEGIRNIFTTSVMGNYHPITILTYAIEYSKVRLDPWLYHFDSLLFHVICTVLVYWLVQLLTRKPVAGIVAALLFGLHPMHIESVAWLAGRKDVVYGMFYIAACITHVYYVRRPAGRALWYTVTIVLYLLSLLSKPVAVVLPVTLLLIDYYEGRLRKATFGADDTTAKRPLNFGILIEKIPHFVIAIGFGLRSIQDQKAFGALNTQDVSYNLLERVALGGYALVTYLWKAVMPVGLSNFYPYPVKDGNMVHVKYFIFPAVALALLWAAWRFGRRQKNFLFGILFFLVNIALLLQFLPVGGAIIADRYSYIPYLGLFFTAGWFVAHLIGHSDLSRYKTATIGISALYLCLLGYQANARCKDWYATTSLWRDEIEKQPTAPNAYNNLGFNYFNMFNESVNPTDRKRYYDSSFMLLTKAIELDPKFVNPLVSLGELYRASGDFPSAKRCYYRAIAINDKEGNANAYLGLAIIYSISQNFDSADFSFHAAIMNKPYFPEAHSNYGNYFDMMSQRPGLDPVTAYRLRDSSMSHYTTAISQNPDMYAPYLNRARLLYHMKKFQEAMADFDRAASLQPQMGEIYYWRAICCYEMGNRGQATRDLDEAIRLGYREINPNFVNAVKGGR